MNQLIPKKYILSICTKDQRDSEFEALCKANNIALIEYSEEADPSPLIEELRPEIIIIEESGIGKEIAESICAKFRTSRYNPFKLVVLEVSEHKTEAGSSSGKNLEYLKKGADDVISKSTSVEEIFVKCQLVLDRQRSAEINQLTNLPSINRTNQIIEHCINQASRWAVLHMDLLNFKSYNLMYGLDNGDSALREVATYLQNSAPEDSFVGHIGRDDFLIICHEHEAEELASKLKLGFEALLEKLYKPLDFNNKYIISAGPNKIRRRIGLLSPNIGECNSLTKNFSSAIEVIEEAIKNKEAKTIKDKTVLILEGDKDFGNLLVDTLSLEGYKSYLSQGEEHLLDEVEKLKPRVLVLEASEISLRSFKELCESLEKYKKEFGLQILVATNVPGYQNFLETGADVYLPKPYELTTIFKEIRRLRHYQL